MPPDISSDELILVEYLDGELPLRDRRIVEERLAGEPELRETLASLEESWRYLDLLDRIGTDKDLVETTLETVVISTEQSVDEQERRARRRIPWRILLRSLGLLLFFAFFFHVGAHLAPNDNFVLRIASPIIERLDMYLMLLDDDPNLETLRLLTERRVFLPPRPTDAPPIDPKSFYPSPTIRMIDSLSVFPSVAELQRRAKKIENLDATLYNQFYWNNKKFQSFSWQKKHKLRELHEGIEQCPARYELSQTLRAFYQWYKSLQPYERAELRRQDLSAKSRVDRITALKRDLEDDHVPLYASPTRTEILAESGDANISDLARTLEGLDMMQLDQTLGTAPDQTINLLMRLYSEEQSSHNGP